VAVNVISCQRRTKNKEDMLLNTSAWNANSHTVPNVLLTTGNFMKKSKDMNKNERAREIPKFIQDDIISE
jgi:CRISPR/Cas system-associated protein Csx1